ncbi:type IV pili twitching motility protein PilT [Candidatus Falkowbacteria bacterium CG10_big_fil_rev_8_21_14_0_10_44_15]|uniref:Type IV pili twitching motility protein PilT n=1 Tax=Candidatus Falkowbacteria bacterium CG10_big_fil_rev_8_21_14_0_10_44_15 TaxID=1974569 RepID=A0A2H0UZB5_9BACT|nr:MAG: type IV pili twitching motility protein PilT [Candidatus Falkowbacteria bacterium CG10_big_fil_rev_8_21_14_0_10_44_15]
MDIQNYFKIAIAKGAADLHLVGGSLAAVRIGEQLIPIEQASLVNSELETAVVTLLNEKQKQQFLARQEVDFSKEILGARFRINLHWQEGKVGLTARVIAKEVPVPDKLGFSETLYNLTHLRDGLILVVGPSGNGKSSTLAALLDIINTERKAHIITIEDPIEFLFKEKQSIIEQRELGTDTRSFAEALRAALRQDPNVIMVGEMRDQETIAAALTAAETGHLVLSTLHTSNAPETIQRITDFFPADKRQQILNQLASNLRAVIAQELLPTKDGGRVAAREIMINNSAVANLIRAGSMNQIMTAIQTGGASGMIVMNQAIDKLLEAGLIEQKVAENRKRDLETKSVYY